MAKKDSKYISVQDYDRKYGAEITINNCTPEAWNALGGNYEKDIKDPFYNPQVNIGKPEKLPF